MYKVEKVDLKIIVTVDGIEYESNTITAVTVCEYCVANNNDGLCGVLLPYCKAHDEAYFTVREVK